MIKKSGKLLLSYVVGIVLSLFLAIPLSPMLGFSPVLFSVITAWLTVAFMYSVIWKMGKYDALKKNVSVLNPILSMSMFIAISVVVELLVVFIKPTASIDIAMLISSIWFFPFMGFYTKATFFAVTIIITLAIIGISVLAYYMGIKGFSLTDKILNERKRRRDIKAEKHFEEIEKIKEQYRKKD